MACIRKRRGKWVIDYRDTAGKRRWETATGNRKDAEERLAKIAGGGYKAIDGKRTFEEYAKDWMETHVKANTKMSTYYEYDSVLRNHLLPAFANVPFSKIGREMVKRFVAEKVQGNLSKSHIRNITVPLREMFNHAIDDGAMIPNPAARLGRFNHKKDTKKKINPLTRAEVSAMLETAREKMPEHYPMLLCAVRTGMRAGELAALQWQDIDFAGRFIEVRRNSSRGEIVTPKNGKSRRVDMSLQLTNTLDALLAQRKAEAVKISPQEKNDVISRVMESPVFIKHDGRSFDPNDLRRQIFYKVLSLAGMRRVRFHDLRHSFASLLIGQGENLVYIKDQLGHSSIQITVDTYGHLIPSSNRIAVDKLDDMASGELPAKNGSKLVVGHDRMKANYA